MTAAPVDRVLEALGGGRRSGASWSARCPAHQDRNASLSISVGRNDRVLLKCHAGCEVPDVVRCAGLEMTDLYPPKDPAAERSTIVATYPYVDEAGQLLFEVVRKQPKDFRQRRPKPAGGWEWSLNGTRRVLYRLPEVITAVAEGRRVFVAEGEKDVDALIRAGEVATCGPMGAGKWPQVATLAQDVLAGAEVIIVADKDRSGRAHAAEIVASLTGVAGDVTVVEAATGKDAADHLGAGRSIDELLEVIDLTEAPDPGPDQPGDDEAAVRAEGLRAGLLTIEQLASLPQPDQLVEDVLFSNALGFIYGKPGSAKTFVALDWALSVATGTRWQGLHVTQARVLWIAAEGAEGLHKRIWSWMVEHQTHQIPPEQLVVYPAPINLFDPKQAAGLAALVTQERYGLVVIDTLARSSLGAEENSAKDMGQVVEAAESIRRASRAAVLLVHHTARNGESPRGSSAIDGAAYTLWKTELEGDTVSLVNEKAKESARTTTMRLQLVPRLDSIVLHRATGTAEGLTAGPLQLLRLLAEMADDTGVPHGAWRRAAEKDGVAERSFYRWHKGLAEQGFTASDGPARQKRWNLTDLGVSALGEP